jgi:hypothetical protein
MSCDEDLAIPGDVRAMAEEGVAQVRAAYDQFAETVQHTHEIAARSGGELAASALEIQAQAAQLADANIKSGLEAAVQMASAPDLEACLAIQSTYLVNQMAATSRQALVLWQMLVEALERSGSVKG